MSDTTSTHVGGVLEGRLHLPKDYRYAVGAETAHFGQIAPKSASDQWRVGAVFATNDLARPIGSRFSPDVSVRAGFLRGANGPVSKGGFYSGLAAALPIRVSGNKEPWELDDLVYTSVAVVPEIGANAILPNGANDIGVELTATLGLRVTISSTLLP